MLFNPVASTARMLCGDQRQQAGSCCCMLPNTNIHNVTQTWTWEKEHAIDMKIFSPAKNFLLKNFHFIYSSSLSIKTHENFFWFLFTMSKYFWIFNFQHKAPINEIVMMKISDLRSVHPSNHPCKWHDTYTRSNQQFPYIYKGTLSL